MNDDIELNSHYRGPDTGHGSFHGNSGPCDEIVRQRIKSPDAGVIA